jgi:hypothetical protein
VCLQSVAEDGNAVRHLLERQVSDPGAVDMTCPQAESGKVGRGQPERVDVVAQVRAHDRLGGPPTGRRQVTAVRRQVRRGPGGRVDLDHRIVDAGAAAQSLLGRRDCAAASALSVPGSAARAST